MRESFDQSGIHKYERVIVVPFSNEEYKRNLEDLKKMGSEKIARLLRRVEKMSKGGNLGFDSLGPLLQGFSIDPVTLCSIRTVEHSNVSALVELVTGKRGKTDSDNLTSIEDAKEVYKRTTKGLVYTRVPGLKVPVVRLFSKNANRGDFSLTDKDRTKIIDHIKVERELLPVDDSCNPL